jgi:putative nucleotidyltransferase with HDIG domain
MEPTWKFPGTPEPPEWRLDFGALVERFAWLRALSTCLQDPEWHAEGDVLTHTGMVAAELAAMPEWRALPAEERQVLFAAALLHDVAKPQQTKEEEGRIRSKGHARQGAQMARRIFMEELPEVPFAAREAVVGLVRHHGVPAYFLMREDPVRTMIRASYGTRLDLLCVLAAADARGRVMRGSDDMPDRVALFRETAEEEGCLRESYRFANDHSRVAYFRTPGMLPTVQLYDDTRCCVTVMSGLPAAGKDTWVLRHADDQPVIALDDLRAELEVEAGGDQSAVIAAAKEQARLHLRKNESFIWNATNTTRFLRDGLVGFFLGYHARVKIVYCEAPLTVIAERNGRRAQPVPAGVIDRLVGKLEVPEVVEAHAIEHVVAW